MVRRWVNILVVCIDRPHVETADNKLTIYTEVTRCVSEIIYFVSTWI